MTGMVRARYTLEFKQEAVGLVRGGQSLSSVARGLGVSAQSIDNWVKADAIGGLMKANGLHARGKRKFKATTNSNHTLPVSPNLLERNFSTLEPNRVWTGDITYVRTEEGWLYRAVVIDLFSRQVVGFAMHERMTRQLVIDALRMAWFRRRPASGLIEVA